VRRCRLDLRLALDELVGDIAVLAQQNSFRVMIVMLQENDLLA
jgi:hypothetical protein